MCAAIVDASRFRCGWECIFTVDGECAVLNVDESVCFLSVVESVILTVDESSFNCG